MKLKKITDCLFYRGLILLLLAGCATLGEPSLPEPHSEEALLFIPPFSGSDFLVFGDEYFKITLSFGSAIGSNSGNSDSDIAKHKSIKLKASDLRDDLRRVFKLNPGKYTIESVEYIADPDHKLYRGIKKSFADIDFTLHPGTVTILPYKFEVFADQSGLYISDIPEIDKEEESKLWEKLEPYKNIEMWKRM